MTWLKWYRINRATLVRYFGEGLTVPIKNSAESVKELYR